MFNGKSKPITNLGETTKDTNAKDTIATFASACPEYRHLISLKNDPSGSPTVGQHTEAVMNQLLRYPFRLILNHDEIKLLKVLMACHDLEKYPENGNRGDSPEHDRAEKWLKKFAPLFGLGNHKIDTATTLLQSEVLGQLMKQIAPARPSGEAKTALLKSILELRYEQQRGAYHAGISQLYQTAAESQIKGQQYQEIIATACCTISTEAAKCKLTPSSYLLLAMTFYQCDCSTYTADSVCESENLRGKLSMEFLFELKPDAELNSTNLMIVFEKQLGRMKMRGIFESAMRDLEAAVANASNSTEKREIS